MIDLDKMTLEEVLAYCEQRDLWFLKAFIDIDGLEKSIEILAENGRL